MEAPNYQLHDSLIGLYVATWGIEALLLLFPYSLLIEEAKRFEEGLQDEKNFLYIQRRYVSLASPS